jgi:lysophospholipase L1-like esterase
MRGIRAGLGRAAAGGLFHAAVFGDSLGVVGGNDPATPLERNSFPRRMGRAMADALGVREAGGISPVTGASGVLTDEWTSTGTVTKTAPFVTMSTGSTYTKKSLNRGTTVDIYLSNESAACTYQIDGAGAVAITAGDTTATVRKISITGLADTAHEVKINGPASGTVKLLSIDVGATKGVQVHNLCYGGTRAASGTAAQNWTDDASTSGVYWARKLMLDAAGITPDVVIFTIGGNDIFFGDALATAIDGLEEMREWWPDVDAVFVQAWEVPTTDLGDWDDYLAAKYELADELGVLLVDWRHRFGDSADADAAGLTGTDDIHPALAATLEMGRNLGEILAGTGPGYPRLEVAPTGAPFAHLPDDTELVEFTP